jgi:hypothetical protein
MRTKSLIIMLIVVISVSVALAKSSSIPNSPDRLSRKEMNAKSAAWTVMVYMDGDNNLEEDALMDFMEMARVGSTDEVNIIVQLDRIGKYVTEADERFPFWTETLRFRIREGMKPSRDHAISNIGEANMGSGKTLENFVSWATTTFPADHYALIIWDHGQGWRRVFAPTDEVRSIISKTGQDILTQPQIGTMTVAFPFKTPIGSPYRTISYDETDKDKLYTREIQTSLLQVLKNRKLDLIAFDACLMGMVEVAYAMRGVAETSVGSEELVPGTGFQYNDWLSRLKQNPLMDGHALGDLLVDSYQRRYGTATEFLEPIPVTTLSSIDLSKLDSLANAITAMSKSLITKFPAEKQNIKLARDECSVYAPNALGDGRDYFFHIDLTRFLERLVAHTQDQDIKNSANSALNIIQSSVLRNYAGENRKGGTYGSNGLAIYFPPNGSSYDNDWLREGGYENSRTRLPGQKEPVFPVEFVESHYWADFLHVYFSHFR